MGTLLLTLMLYYNQAQWQSAMGQNVTNVDLGSVSITSICNARGICAGGQSVSNGVLSDTLDKYGSTTLNFGQNVYGFGGNFNIASGTGLDFSVGGEVPYAYYTGTNPLFQYPGYNGFIGVVSTQSLNSLVITAGDNGTSHGAYGNEFTLSDLEVGADVSAAPEPDLRLFVAFILLFVSSYAIFRR